MRTSESEVCFPASRVCLTVSASLPLVSHHLHLISFTGSLAAFLSLSGLSQASQLKVLRTLILHMVHLCLFADIPLSAFQDTLTLRILL
eukprot:g78942.t1